MKSILLVGGNRFFGKRFAELALQRGHSLTLINRGARDDGLGTRVERIRADRSELAQVTKSRHWDLVVDQVCYDAAEARAACAALRGKTSRYFFTSTVSVYDLGANLREQDFNSRDYCFTQDVSRSQDYGVAKRQAEAVFFSQNDFPVVALRFPFVLGEDDYTGRLNFHVDRVREGRKIYFPQIDARTSFIHAQDAAYSMLALIDLDFEGALNIGPTQPLALRDLIMMIEKSVGKKAQLGAGEPSPYGIEGDWFTNTEKLHSLGIKPREILSWLPSLILAN
jgi:nucleoside-diphosphate-sugar epimerase